MCNRCACNWKINSQRSLACNWRSQEVPRGPKDQKNSRFRSGLKISSENEIFERATHRGPIFVGKSRRRDRNFRARSKISIETKNFDRDQTFLIVGPSGYLMEAPELHNIISARKPRVTDVLCNFEIHSKIIKMCV